MHGNPETVSQTKSPLQPYFCVPKYAFPALEIFFHIGFLVVDRMDHGSWNQKRIPIMDFPKWLKRIWNLFALPILLNPLWTLFFGIFTFYNWHYSGHLFQNRFFSPTSIFSSVLEGSNDYFNTLNFRRGWLGEVGVITFFILEVPDYKSAMLIYLYIYQQSRQTLFCTKMYHWQMIIEYCERLRSRVQCIEKIRRLLKNVWEWLRSVQNSHMVAELAPDPLQCWFSEWNEMHFLPTRCNVPGK